MPRTPIWKSIAAELEGEIARHLYRAGDKLPTEAELSARFGVNRHTARRALADLAERGLVHSRRGAGVFVTATPLDYAIGARVRFHRNIRATGRLPEKRVLRVETRPADTAEAEALALPPGAPVIVYEGLSLAEGAPIAHFFSCFPAERLPGLADTLRETSSVTEALRRNGVTDYTRARTRLTAEAASPTQALHLATREGAPLLRSESVNIDPEGQPVEYGLTWFAGDRVALTVAPEDAS
ncbi:phosphonate metabolism transcriptional regulator PhnF [Salipiger abyssi]|jgi:GntR family phosphonate transport system transcriptional regulator|uniref:GntR family transcriptional regulator n=1 Tax=Salipiger abyssi TaxID=1250539 RepID=A0A1P8UWW9_9RHOB|nr:phosphonate metabolism transcriptional regulator PhnF [Salipiger abyssi]APZ53888.1 GntR family transcriptional regulator [Salipiger abyssi]